MGTLVYPNFKLLYKKLYNIYLGLIFNYFFVFMCIARGYKYKRSPPPPGQSAVTHFCRV